MKQFRWFTLLGLLFALLVGCSTSSTPQSQARFTPYPEEAQLLGLTNDFRSKAQTCGTQQFPPAPVLTWVESIGDTAWFHSVDMNNANTEDHVGASTVERMKARGFDAGTTAENRKKTSTPASANDAFNAWVADPTACANLMNPAFTVMGAGMSGQWDNTNASNSVFWTQILSTPAGTTPAPGLTVAPTTATATVGGAAIPLTATLTNSNATINWGITGPGSLSATTGTNVSYIPPTTGGAGTAIVVARTDTLTATATITVNVPNTPTLDVTPAQGTTTVGGDPITFTATTNQNQTIGWALGGNSPGSISNTAGGTTTYTPPATGNGGTAVLCAAVSATLNKCVSITINAAAPAITVTPTNAMVKVGDAPIVFKSSTNQVNWSMTGVGIFSFVGETFTYTPPATGTGGTATITATLVPGGQTATATVTVVTLGVTPATVTAAVGGAAIPFTATLTNSNAPINWSLNGPGIISATTGATINYTPPPTGGAATATLTASVGTVTASATINIVPAGGLQVQITDLQRTPVVLPVAIHNTGLDMSNRPVAPMAANPNGGALILWTRQADNKAFLTNIDGNGNAVGNDQDLGTGNAGAVGTDGTKVSYMLKTGDNQLAFRVVGGSETLLVNNSQPGPWLNASTTFGNDKMLRPMDFRRLAVLPIGTNWFASFDHNNDFGAGGVHTGMSMVMLDSNGTNSRLGVAWGTSHSLDILALSDGTNILNVTVGDSFPQDFRLHVLDTQGQPTGAPVDLFAKNTFNIGTGTVSNVPGTGTGVSAGKLGGLHNIGGGRFVLTYVIKDIAVIPGKTGEPKMNEVGFLNLDKQGNAQRFRLRDASDVKYVRSARYGNNILVAWENTAGKFMAMVVDTQGNTVKAEQELVGGAAFSERDSFINLANGDVMWDAVVGGSLKVFRLPAP